MGKNCETNNPRDFFEKNKKERTSFLLHISYHPSFDNNVLIYFKDF